MNNITAEEVTTLTTKLIDKAYKYGESTALDEVLEIIEKYKNFPRDYNPLKYIRNEIIALKEGDQKRDVETLKVGGQEVQCAKQKEACSMTLDSLLDGLDRIVSYNGYGEIVEEWSKLEPNENGVIFCPIDMGAINDPIAFGQLQVLWMLCVYMFGGYGLSPRFGMVWGENVVEYREFLQRIIRLHLENRRIEGMEEGC